MASRNRGRPKPKISDVSRTPPTEEELGGIVALLDTKQHPITEAILGAALVEHYLEQELRRYFPRRDDTTWAELTSEIGPLGTFHRKITFAHAVKILDDDLKHNLNIVRNVRNQFAHAKKVIDFNHPLIAKEIRKAKAIPGFRKDCRDYIAGNKHGPQYAYGSLCVLLSTKLLSRHTRSMQGQRRRYAKKAKVLTDKWNNLMSLGIRGPGSPLQSLLAAQDAGSSQKAPQGLLPAWLGQLPKHDGTGGNKK